MSEIVLEGKSYKEVKISNLIIDGKEQDTLLILPEQLKGKSQIKVTIQTEPEETVKSSEAKLEE